MQERSFEVIDFDHTQRTRCHAERHFIKILSPWFYGLYNYTKISSIVINVFKSLLRRTVHTKNIELPNFMAHWYKIRFKDWIFDQYVVKYFLLNIIKSHCQVTLLCKRKAYYYSAIKLNLNAVCLFFLIVVTSNCSIALKSTLRYLRSCQYLLYMILKKIKETRVIYLLRSPLSYLC